MDVQNSIYKDFPTLFQKSIEPAATELKKISQISQKNIVKVRIIGTILIDFIIFESFRTNRVFSTRLWVAFQNLTTQNPK